MNPPTESDLNSAIAHGLSLGRKADAGVAITAAELMLASLAFELSRQRSTSGDLFAPAELAAESPRLAWMKKHVIRTHNNRLIGIAADHQWEAFSVNYGPGIRAFGATEDEALAALAAVHNIKLWNEEGA